MTLAAAPLGAAWAGAVPGLGRGAGRPPPPAPGVGPGGRWVAGAGLGGSPPKPNIFPNIFEQLARGLPRVCRLRENGVDPFGVASPPTTGMNLLACMPRFAIKNRLILRGQGPNFF